jgi:hypothetical protein
VVRAEPLDPDTFSDAFASLHQVLGIPMPEHFPIR